MRIGGSRATHFSGAKYGSRTARSKLTEMGRKTMAKAMAKAKKGKKPAKKMSGKALEPTKPLLRFDFKLVAVKTIN
jgi:hypothetical protein